MLDVSVVVPFFNPAANLGDCVASLLDQTLPRDRFEVLLVDDGSTDGSDARARRYAEENADLIRVIRIPASGWPGRPRNVGIDQSRGRYIQFVDSDDTMDPMALERLLDIAVSSEADIVVGKLSSDFRGLNHPVFRRTVTGRTIYDYPLVETLTPHKMVRRQLLLDHSIRFAEGPRHVEDEHFSMQIYTRASSVAVVGDLACYFYRRRRVSGRNLGDTEAAPADYYRDLGAVLDVIDEHVSDPAARSALQRRFYRNEMLGRLRGRQMQAYSPGYRRDVFERVRDLARTRFAPDVREGLGCFVRTQSRLVVDDDLEGLASYAAWLASVRLRANSGQPGWTDGRLAIDIDATLMAGDEPLVLDRDGEEWTVPVAVAPAASRQDRRVTADDVASADLDCATISRADSQLWSTTDGLRLSITDDGEISVSGRVLLDPLALRGGRPLGDGLWDLRLRVMFGGLTTSSALRPGCEPAPPPCHVWAGSGATVSAQPYWTSPSPMLALDIGEWSHPLSELIPVEVEPALHGRRLEIAVPAIQGPPATRPAQLHLLATDEPSPAVLVPATLSITPDGSILRGKLPRRVDGAQWRLWARIGEPGGAPPVELPWILAKDGRHLFIRRSPSVGRELDTGHVG